VRRRRASLLRVAASVVGLVALVPAIIEAVYVAPTAVFMDDRSDAAEVTIGNSGDTPEEATVELKFGFPDADSAGTPFVRIVDDPGPEYPSAADWIRAYPQRVRLAPRSQQVVRLLARPPANLPDGEYWTRLIVTGRGASIPVVGADSTVRAGVNLVIRLVASVTYRKGRVWTGVAVRDLGAEADADSLTLWAHLDRLGNAAFLGTADVELVGARDSVVRRWSSALAVYVPMRRRFAFPLDSVAAGDYRVRFRLRTERPDLPADRVLQAPTVTDSVAVRVG
jgi:hypothetical protein